MSTTILPSSEHQRQRDQQLAALAVAQKVRLARAELKQRIDAGDASAVTVILTVPLEARGWSVLELLMSQRQWGRSRSLKLLSRHGIPERALGALSERQRRVLAAALTRAGVLEQAEEARR